MQRSDDKKGNEAGGWMNEKCGYALEKSESCGRLCEVSRRLIVAGFVFPACCRLCVCTLRSVNW